MSFLMSSSHLFFGFSNGLVNISVHLYTFLTILSSEIECKWQNQINRCVLCSLLCSHVLLIYLIHHLF